LASFLGWLALMIIFSPFLQMLMALFSAQVTLWLSKPGSENAIAMAENE
jgi:hypothetical protein